MTVFPEPPRPHVAIVGGGLAGEAAASRLVGKGLRLTLLESRPRLGGRACSFLDPATGESIDNCQHISMGCCVNFADFCRRVGTRHLFKIVDELLFVDESGTVSRMKANRLPAPLHLAASLPSAAYLTPIERARVAFGLICLRFARPSPTESFADWLARHGQTRRTIDRYWATVLVSALNERLDRMDVGLARKVFLDGFMRNRRGYVMEIPLVPLGELNGTRVASWLSARGVDVRLGTGVRAIEIDAEGGVVGVRLRNGERLAADFVVSAVPFDRVSALFDDQARLKLPMLADVDAIEPSPITGIHLWFDRPVCPFEHVAIVGKTIDWVFDHTRLQNRGGENGGQYLQIVVSASRELAEKTNEAIVSTVLADLASLWPETATAKLLKSRVVTEHAATFAVRPGIEALRPSQRTPIDGLFLAGEWTATGWPSTMEGAVRSGYLAAEGILEDLGRPETLLRPDLPGGRLSRLLLGSAASSRPRFRPAFPSAIETRSIPGDRPSRTF